jgi:hypothetical protein
MMQNFTVFMSVGLALASPAASQQFLDPSVLIDACEPLVTVQKRGCTVETVYQCSDPAGPATVLLHSQDGEQSSVEAYTADGLIAYVGSLDGSYWMQVTDTPDPLDQDAMISDGFDTFAQNTETVIGDSGPISGVFSGTMFLTGEEEIDGVTFLAGRSDYSFETDGLARRTINTIYLNKDFPFVLTGRSESINDGEANITDYSPVDLILPSEPGFGALQGLYDCGDFG